MISSTLVDFHFLLHVTSSSYHLNIYFLTMNFCFRLSVAESPLLVSYPHFLHADTEYLTKVDGLKPDKERHETEFLIEPVSNNQHIKKKWSRKAKKKKKIARLHFFTREENVIQNRVRQALSLMEAMRNKL